MLGRRDSDHQTNDAFKISRSIYNSEIGDRALLDAKLQTLEHRRKAARLSVFYRIYFGECAN